MTKLATYAANKPSKTKSKVATKLWNAFLLISLKVLFANLQPTDAPRINKQKLIEASGSLYDAISNICKIPLATNVPESNAAGTFALSKKKYEH